MANMNPTRTDTSSPIFQRAVQENRVATEEEEGVMSTGSPRPLTADPNGKRAGAILTSPTSSHAVSRTNKAVIVARTETKEKGGNKKAIESPSSLEPNGFYTTSSGANAGENEPSICIDEKDTGAQHCQLILDEYGVWKRRSNGHLVKCASQDSIIVQAQVKTCALSCDCSPSDDLVASMHSRSSISTMIKPIDKKESSRDRLDGREDANGLPSYELASAYVHSNAYADMGTAKATTRQPNSCDQINQYDQSPTSPSSAITNAAAVINQQQRMAHSTRESSLEPIGEDERLMQATQGFINSQPGRSKRAQVLRYFSAAKAFQVRVVGGDVQITDSEGCPLFDAYQELDCRHRWWNVEAYGDRVLLMREELLLGDGSSTSGSRVTITDWNGELFGYLVTGDPLRMESTELVALGRFCSQPAIVNNAACSNATAVPKACWVCSAAGGDGREQQMARLEAYQRILFLSDYATDRGEQHSNFHVKLMILAGVIRIVGSLTVNPVTDCLALTKFFCNCCAYK